MAKIITIGNQKGGVGKTTTVVTLAAEFGRRGHPVLVIDHDPQGNASRHIADSASKTVDKHAFHLLTNDFDTYAEVVETSTNQGFENVSLVRGPLDVADIETRLRDCSTRPYELLANRIRPLREHYDFVLVDTPPALGLLTGNALAASDVCVAPVETSSDYGQHGILSFTKLVNQIKSEINPNLKLLGILLTMHDARLGASSALADIADEVFGNVLPVRIRKTIKICEAAMEKRPIQAIAKTATAAEDYAALADYLLEQMG
ncbi:ParA family protein [Methylomagnum sp.]